MERLFCRGMRNDEHQGGKSAYKKGSRKGIEPISPTTIDFRVFRRALPCKVVLYGDKSQQNPSKIYSP